MPLRVGQSVRAAKSFGPFGSIGRGTPGIVIRASFLGEYDVKFVGGRVVRGLRRDQLETRGALWMGGGCLLWLASLGLAAGLVMWGAVAIVRRVRTRAR